VGPATLENIKELGYVDPDDCADDVTESEDDVTSEDGEEK